MYRRLLRLPLRLRSFGRRYRGVHRRGYIDALRLEPVAASNIELRSMPLEADDEEPDPSNEAKSELDRPTELIAHLFGN